MPYLFSALKVSSSLAIIGALVGEFITANKGIGFLIISNYYSLNIAAVFANIITISIIGVVFYNLINFFEEKIITWNTIENN
jgi:NitT/TauT family transport system permease protein